MSRKRSDQELLPMIAEFMAKNKSATRAQIGRALSIKADKLDELELNGHVKLPPKVTHAQAIRQSRSPWRSTYKA